MDGAGLSHHDLRPRDPSHGISGLNLVLACHQRPADPLARARVSNRRAVDAPIDSTVCSEAGCAKAGAEINMARTAVLLDSARRRFAQPAFVVKCMMDSPLNVRRLCYFLRLFLGWTLTRTG